TSVATGAGLTGGPITATGTIAIASGGVTNAMLQSPSLTVTAGAGLSGGGSVALGGSVSLALGLVGTANGGTGIATAPTAAGQFLRSSGAGTWAVSGLSPSDLPNLAASYVDLVTNQTIDGVKTFTSGLRFSSTGAAL